MIETKTFQCGNCKGIFDKPEDWSDEKANKESKVLFGIEEASKDPDCVPVCEDCFIKLTGCAKMKRIVNGNNDTTNPVSDKHTETILLSKEDVESAVMQFICSCYPEYAKGHIIQVYDQTSCTAIIYTTEKFFGGKK